MLNEVYFDEIWHTNIYYNVKSFHFLYFLLSKSEKNLSNEYFINNVLHFYSDWATTEYAWEKNGLECVFINCIDLECF